MRCKSMTVAALQWLLHHAGTTRDFRDWLNRTRWDNYGLWTIGNAHRGLYDAYMMGHATRDKRTRLVTTGHSKKQIQRCWFYRKTPAKEGAVC